MSSITESMKTIVAKITVSIQEIITGLTSQITGAIDKIFGSIVGVLEQVDDKFAIVYEGIFEIVEQAMSTLADANGTILMSSENIHNAAELLIGSISSKFTQMISSVTDTITAYFDKVDLGTLKVVV